MTINNSINANIGTPLPIIDGGTGVNSVTTTPTATSFAGWDANKNFRANSVIQGYTSTPMNGGTTTLTAASTQQQYFSGNASQTVLMPVTSTLSLGQTFYLTNTSPINSGAILIVESSGGNLINLIYPNMQAIVTCVNTAGTGSGSWNISETSGIGTITNWTPVFTFAVPGDLNVTYTTQSGIYYQLGRIIFIDYTIRCTPTFTTAAQGINILGLPTAVNAGVNNTGSILMQGGFTFPAGTTTVTSLAAQGTSLIQLFAFGSGVPATSLTAANFTSGIAVTLIGSLFYVL